MTAVMADNGDSAQSPVDQKTHRTDAMATKAADRAGQLHEKKEAVTSKKEEKKGPSGGFDDTPIPRQPPGWTVKLTFHRAINLPMADINTLSSDPYILAQINHKLPTRHKQDPAIRLRTPTIRRNTQPVWDCDWILCNVPSSGFELKARIYDEDPADHDDRLGNVHVRVSNLREGWPGIKEEAFRIKKRMGSKRAYLVRGCASLFERELKMSGELVVSVTLLGPTQDDNGGRIYTLGPCAWSQHFSPVIGRLVGITDPEKIDKDKAQQKYDFQANQVQLRGPVPAKLYHRYVEFRPFVSGMFNAKSLRGRLLNRALHHQHARIYNYDRATVYGSFAEPCTEMTKQFLDLVHYDEGARVFTYVLNLDGQWRFTETGPQFGIDLLSKHTMHSDVNIYVAFAGEFFIRRLDSEQVAEVAAGGSAEDDRVAPEASKHRHKIGHYQLIIDNDSGTYRPNQDTLPLLKEFLQRNLPGLNIMTLSCVKDEKKMNKMKDEQRKRQKNEGPTVAMAQADDSSSISSSDEENLDRAAGEDVPSKKERVKRRISDPKAAVKDWTQKGDHSEQNDNVPKSRGQDEKREEKDEKKVEAAEAKTGEHEGNKEQGSADAVNMKGEDAEQVAQERS